MARAETGASGSDGRKFLWHVIYRIGLIFAPFNRSASYLSIYVVHLVNRRQEMVDRRYSGSGGVGGE